MKSSRILKGAATLTLALGLLPVAVEARNQLTLDQAVQKCTDRAIQYGRKPYGPFADSPPDYKVQTQYRACVYANSGQYPTAKVKYRDSILTLLRDAF
ncbi:hypothetical protein [Amylibacter sp. IMCC11727]|uniref:hypothetical protein n=1 Tax=Amylibacter sp. IMCC11727 TaxID=3039851 RepID=UPI00244DF438|nr:hypothetical protein [Amylibacter sp. IMCC11727]WGI23139.1 hypothetical protein QBD29_06885 [Amylibacter sp. IMCC11727]